MHELSVGDLIMLMLMHGLKPDANNNLEKIDEFNIESSINRNIYVYDKYLIQDKS